MAESRGTSHEQFDLFWAIFALSAKEAELSQTRDSTNSRIQGTEVGQQLKELSDGPHRDQGAKLWQEALASNLASTPLPTWLLRLLQTQAR